MTIERRTGPRWQPWALLALSAVLLVYANSLDNGFHFDDFHTITDNPAIRSLRNVPAFFHDASLFSVQPANRTYRPVVSTSLALDYALAHHRYDVLPFHLSTLFWFVTLLSLLGLLWFRAMESIRPEERESNALWALATAAWFGLHPAMAETVNYVIQRGDVYCTLGCVAALFLWAQWPRARRYGVYLVPLAIALLSKPPAAVFPLLLLFWVYFFESCGTQRARWWQAARMCVPSLLLVAVLLLLQVHMTPKTFMPSTISTAAYRLTQPLVWSRYTGELFLPLHLNVDTDLTASTSATPGVLGGFVFLVALLAAILYSARRRDLYPVAFGLLWFALTQLPTSLYALSEVENDHRTFFSFPGLMLAVVWSVRIGVERMLARPHPRWLAAALAAAGLVALAGYAWGAHTRNAVWRSEETLWRDDVEKSPHNGRGRMNYGLTLMSQGQYTEARQEFEEALQYTPNYATLEINLGIVNGALNDAPEAERHFRRAIALDPDDDQPHAYYARWLLDQGRVSEAVPHLRVAVALNPSREMQKDLLARALALPPQGPAALAGVASADAASMTADDWINRSLALNQAGAYADSIAAARQALNLDPGSAIAWNNIAAGYESEGKWDEAIAAAHEALRLQPDFTLARNNLLWSQQHKARALLAQ